MCADGRAGLLKGFSDDASPPLELRGCTAWRIYSHTVLSDDRDDELDAELYRLADDEIEFLAFGQGLDKGDSGLCFFLDI